MERKKPEPAGHDYCEDADELLAQGLINDWEHGFLESIAYRPELSERQEEVHSRICNKVHQALCAAAGERWWK